VLHERDGQLFFCPNENGETNLSNEPDQEMVLSEAESLTSALGIESQVMEDKILGNVQKRAKKGNPVAILTLVLAQHNRWLQHLAREATHATELLEDISFSLDVDADWTDEDNIDRKDK
jgi:hypothetical protein